MKTTTNRTNLIGSIIVLVAVTAGLISFWPRLFGEVTVRQLSEDFDAYRNRTIRVRGTVVGVRPYDFGIGDVDNHMMTLDDDGARIELMFDQLSQRYKPKAGDRVRVVGSVWSYGDVAPEMLIATKIKKVGE